MTEASGWDAEGVKKAMRQKGRLTPLAAAQAALDNHVNTQLRDTAHLHPSEICKRDWCPRASMYQIFGYTPEKTKELSFQTLNIFKTGHDIHDKWQDWLEKAGVLSVRELPINSEEYGILGHADGLIEDFHGKAILEIKSVGMGTVRTEDPDLYEKYVTKELDHDEVWSRIRQPFPQHLRQIMLYMFVSGVHKGIVLYEWKATQSIKEFEVGLQKAIIESILATCAEVQACKTANVLIARPAWATAQDHRICKQCPYNKTCWSTDETDTPIKPRNEPHHEGVPEEVRPARETSGQLTRDSEQLRRIVRR